MEKTIGILILAAGNSSRLGEAKQLLTYKGKTLLRHVIDEARSASPEKILVVTGAAHDAIEKELKIHGIDSVYNENWKQGMGSSIKKGLSELLISCPQLSAVIITVCDQPFVSSEHFRTLIKTYIESNKLIVASSYAGTFGTPALYDSVYFNDLMELQKSNGAKKIIENHKTSMTCVAFEKGEIDIDTAEDYQKLIQT